MYGTWLPSDVEAKLAKKEKMMVVDVRELVEWKSGHIPEAMHIPLSELPLKKDELNKTLPCVIVCQSGGRSSVACKYLSDEGYNVINMMGGMGQWYGKVNY